MATHVIFYGGVAGKIMTPPTLNSNSIWIRALNSGRFASVLLLSRTFQWQTFLSRLDLLKPALLRTDLLIPDVLWVYLLDTCTQRVLNDLLKTMQAFSPCMIWLKVVKIKITLDLDDRRRSLLNGHIIETTLDTHQEKL
jgi:hypothetical protein